jgi:hypothetical protein
LGTLLLPIILISLIAFWLADPFLLVLLFFIYSYFSGNQRNQRGRS